MNFGEGDNFRGKPFTAEVISPKGSDSLYVGGGTVKIFGKHLFNFFFFNELHILGKSVSVSS